MDNITELKENLLQLEDTADDNKHIKNLYANLEFLRNSVQNLPNDNTTKKIYYLIANLDERLKKLE